MENYRRLPVEHYINYYRRNLVERSIEWFENKTDTTFLKRKTAFSRGELSV